MAKKAAEQSTNEFLDINLAMLPEEWAEQPKRYKHYKDLYVEARREHRRAKANLKVVAAELAKLIREDPAKYGLKKDKPSDISVSEMVLLQERYQIALEEEIDAEYREGIKESAVEALAQRKTGLEYEARFLLADFFAEPRAPKENPEINEELLKKAARTILPDRRKKREPS